MKAKSMFKKLGYKPRLTSLHYFKEYKNGHAVFISFDENKVTKCMCGYGYELVEDKYIAITMSELQAINKQCEELGWL